MGICFWRCGRGAAALLVALLASAGPAAAQDGKLLVFVGPIPALDPVWMAEAQGYFKQEGLAVETRTFPSGTTALQTFKVGAGDIV